MKAKITFRNIKNNLNKKQIIKAKDKGYWRSIENQRDFMGELYKKLNFQTFEEWRSLNSEIFTSFGGSTLLVSKYRGNYKKLLSEVYPNYPWGGESDSPSLSIQLLDIDKQIEFVKGIFDQLNLSLSDWTQLTTSSFIEKGGKEILRHYHHSLPSLLKSLFPSLLKHEKISPLNPLDIRYWKSIDNQSLFMSFLFHKLKLKNIDQWKEVTLDQFRSHGGSSLLAQYRNNFQSLLTTIYPDHKWNFILKKRSANFWDKIENQHRFMEQLFFKLSLKSLDDWMEISTKIFIRFGGKDILNFHSNKQKLLSSLFPHFPWQFEEKNKNKNNNNNEDPLYWSDHSNQILLMQQISDRLNFKSIDEFSTITVKKFKESGGGTLLQIYQSNFQLLLRSVYPNHQWNFPLNFQRTKKKKGYWISPSHQLSFLDNLFIKFNLKSLEEWKEISIKKIIDHGGKSLLYHYNFNLQPLLKRVYPNYCWNFSSPTLEKILSLQHKFKVKKKEDWFRIHSIYHPFLYQSLCSIFPTEKWRKKDFNLRAKKSKQRLLFICLNDLFPDYLLYENYRHPFLTMKRSLELDLFIPSLNIAFEYQGEQHFDELISNGFSPLEVYQSNDHQKSELCKFYSIKLMIVPYWWDSSPSSLLSSISSL